jgi:hypothetical protein
MPSPSRYYSSTAAKTTLAVAIDSVSASIQLATASGLPSQYPFTLILEKDTANEEIINVTGLVGTNYTVTRGQDGSTAKAHNIGAIVEHGVSARDFTESRAHEVASSAHNVTGDIVGTNGAQTPAGKTLTSPTINTPTIAGATISGAFTSTATITGGTYSSATLGSNLSAGGFKITNLGTPTLASDAVRKDFADAQVAAAATSATSASNSATAAATSATSAANSATASANSASAAATSASSAATSASSAATSASTMLASVTAAATSAASALASQTAAATSAASALTSQTAAATSASSAATSASSAATSASSAATSASSAATSASNAQAYELSANNWATLTSGPVAGGEYSAKYHAIAAATSASSASTSATSAATSATQAATSATSAAASATAAASSATTASASVATIAGYASAAATSEANALTSANSAATSAASAAASTSAAATSASSAAASASSAETSATAAAASYDSFDDRYLGAKSTPPSVDNDGNALITGAIYWNSVSNAMFAWSGSAWGSISSTADIFRYRYTASGGETSESGPDDNGVTLSYLPGKEQVYLNGVLLVRTQDYIATNGTSISSLSPALISGDVLEIITFTAFDIATAIPNTILDAKGDLIVASTADVPGKLTVGSDGQVLTASSTTALGVTWASPAPGYLAPTLGTTVVTSGVTVTTINGLTLAAPTLTGTVTASGDINLSGAGAVGSVNDEFALIIMGAI